ncbi:CLUMA_CG018678, isoform A [Clunio marinus]|uniref:CLUMA_CG018678, isoform A n=1 Tax=Clunio marinus TaxID=568069 RepID=A0A1J1IYE5_9DIPT|nr:CLUMA_CG018678, isoform A [Clunio marinus]
MKVFLCLFFVISIVIDDIQQAFLLSTDANASLKCVPIEDQDQDPCSSLLAATSATYQNGYENLERLEEQCTEELNSEYASFGCGYTWTQTYLNTVRELADLTGFSFGEYFSSIQSDERPGDLDCLTGSDRSFYRTASNVQRRLDGILHNLDPQ